jgi:hypothetical protein
MKNPRAALDRAGLENHISARRSSSTTESTLNEVERLYKYFAKIFFGLTSSKRDSGPIDRRETRAIHPSVDRRSCVH